MLQYQDPSGCLSDPLIGNSALVCLSMAALSQGLSYCSVQLFVTPSAAACQASLSFTISQNLLRFMSIKSVMLSNHLILCHPLLLFPSNFPIFKVFFSELLLHQVAKVLELQLQKFYYFFNCRISHLFLLFHW